MSDKIILGKYRDNDNYIKKINPFNLILITLLLSCLIVFSKNIYFELIFFIGFFFFLWINHEPISFYLNLFKSIWLFMISLVLFNLILKTEGEIILLSILKLMNVLYLSQCMISNMKMSDMTDGIALLLKPLSILKLNSSKLAFSITIALHFIPLFLEQGDKVLRSLASRNIIYKEQPMMKKLNLLKVVCIPLFINSIRISDLTSDTMSVRLYDIDQNETKLENWKFSDSLILMIVLYLVLFIVLKEVFL